MWYHIIMLEWMALYMLTFLLWLQIYLGGLLTFNMNGISVKYNFDGCMDNVVFNGVRMIRDTKNGYQGFSMVGVMPDPWNCKVRLETEHGKGPYKAEKTHNKSKRLISHFFNGKRWPVKLTFDTIDSIVDIFLLLFMIIIIFLFIFYSQIFVKYFSSSGHIL